MFVHRFPPSFASPRNLHVLVYAPVARQRILDLSVGPWLGGKRLEPKWTLAFEPKGRCCLDTYLRRHRAAALMRQQ
jgi:hypothetical protein